MKTFITFASLALVLLGTAEGAVRQAHDALMSNGASLLKEEEIALAMAVDSREWPGEAAALEVRPYRALLRRIRLGPDERTLRPLSVVGYSHERLLSSPEGFRGRIVHVYGIVAEIRRVEAPGTGRYDRNEVHAGILVNVRQVPRRPVPVIRFWAFRALRRPGEAPLYPGDRVFLSGYFFKKIPVVDGAGRTHWMPLVVGPWPSYSGRWWPLGIVLRKHGLEDLLPTSELPHEEVWSRLVVDVEEDGRISVDGAPMSRDDARAEIRRGEAAHPGRAVVARFSGEEAEAAARELLAEAGVRRVCFKELPKAGPVRPAPPRANKFD